MMDDYKKPITIRELINKLEEYPDDLRVLVDGYEGGLDYLNFRKTEAFYKPSSYCGSFDEVWYKDEDDTFGVLVLSRDEE